MSRAFIKEDNGDRPESLLDRPVSPLPNYMTPDGHRAMSQQLMQLERELAALKGGEELSRKSRLGRTGEPLTYGEPNDRSIQFAHYLADAGLQQGDVVALFMENHLRYHEIYWGTVRSGMYLCAVNKYLTAEEAAYIVKDSGAKVIVTSSAMTEAAAVAADIHDCPIRLALDGPVDGYESYEDAVANKPTEPRSSEPLGDFMNYSSGTTGRPKGIRRPLTGNDFSSPSTLDGLIKPQVCRLPRSAAGFMNLWALWRRTSPLAA